MNRRIVAVALVAVTCALPAAAAESAEALIAKAWGLYRAKGPGHLEEALAAYEAAKGARPTDDQAAEAQLMIGIVKDHLAKEKADPRISLESREAFWKLVREYPSSRRTADAHFYLAESYAGHVGARLDPSQLDLEKAIQHYQRAIDLADREWIRAQGRFRMGACLESQGKIDEARAAYEVLAAAHPRTQWAEEARQRLSARSAELDKAKTAFREKRYSEALPLLQAVVAAHPKTGMAQEAQLLIAMCHDWLGQIDQEIAALQAYFRDYTPFKGDAAFYYLGSALFRAGRKEEARAPLTTAANDPLSPTWVVQASRKLLERMERR